MRIALIADAYPPMRSSAAVQLRDLSVEMLKQDHLPTVIIPSSDLKQPWLLEVMDGLQVLRLKAPRTKDIGYIRRTINEFLLPFVMLRNLRKSPLSNVKWDGVVWYSPTIFLWPLANALKKASACRSYLIIRDIFPEWAVDMGLLSRGLPYRFFKAIERYQYSVADVIGVQTQGNLAYFDKCNLRADQSVEVLQNWLANSPLQGSSIVVNDGQLAGRCIFVYAGNMGIAQGMRILIDLAESLNHRNDIGFLFVGRGSDAKILCEDAKSRGLSNILFFDEIDPTEIAGLYAQCHIGIVALDSRHKTHNIPGKFLSYMLSGLPVLASINPDNDLVEMINREGVGRVCTDYSLTSLQYLAESLVDDVLTDVDISFRCKSLSKKLFSTDSAVNLIVKSLQR